MWTRMEAIRDLLLSNLVVNFFPKLILIIVLEKMQPTKEVLILIEYQWASAAAAPTKKSAKITWYLDAVPFLDSAFWETCTEFWICCCVILVEYHIKNSAHVYSHHDERSLTISTTTTAEHSNWQGCFVVRSGTGCKVCDEILLCES